MAFLPVIAILAALVLLLAGDRARVAGLRRNARRALAVFETRFAAVRRGVTGLFARRPPVEDDIDASPPPPAPSDADASPMTGEEGPWGRRPGPWG